MFRYFIRRVFLAVPVLLGVATLVFSLIHLVPGDPAQAMLGDGAAPQDVDELRKSLGLDQPLFTQYVSFLRNALTGDLGVSFRTGQPVTRSSSCTPSTSTQPLSILAAVLTTPW